MNTQIKPISGFRAGEISISRIYTCRNKKHIVQFHILRHEKYLIIDLLINLSITQKRRKRLVDNQSTTTTNGNYSE